MQDIQTKKYQLVTFTRFYYPRTSTIEKITVILPRTNVWRFCVLRRRHNQQDHTTSVQDRSSML